MDAEIFHQRIQGKRWLVRYDADIMHDGDVHGLCDESTQTIRIRRDLTPYDFAETLIHELLHAELPDLSEDCVTRVAETIVLGLNQAGLQMDRGVTS